MGSAPLGVQCPLTSSLGEFLGYWAGSGILGYRLSLRRPYLGVFPFTLPLNFILLYGRLICTHSVDSSLTRFLSEYPGFGLVLVPDVMVPEAEQWCAWNRGPWHLAAANVTTRLPRTPSL